MRGLDLTGLDGLLCATGRALALGEALAVAWRAAGRWLAAFTGWAWAGRLRAW